MRRLTHVRRAAPRILSAVALVLTAGCASSTQPAFGPFAKLTREHFEQSLTCDPAEETCACVIDTSLEVSQDPKWSREFRDVRRGLFGGSAPRESQLQSFTDQILLQTLMIAIMTEAAETCGADPDVVPTAITVS